MEDRRRPRQNVATGWGERVMSESEISSKSVQKQIRMRAYTGYLNFSSRGEMREQRIMSLKNQVAGEKGLPISPSMGRVRSGVKKDRNPTRLHKYSSTPHIHDFLFPRIEERNDHVPEKKGNEQRHEPLDRFSPGIFLAHEIACQNQEKCYAAVENRQLEHAGERKGRSVDAHNQVCREEPGYVNPVFPG